MKSHVDRSSRGLRAAVGRGLILVVALTTFACTSARRTINASDGGVDQGTSDKGGATGAGGAVGHASGGSDGGTNPDTGVAPGCAAAADCGVCESCSAAGACTAIKGLDDVVPGRCAGTCDASGVCKSRKGQACNTVATGCTSGLFCAPDGYCCDTACNGACQACDLSGQQGTCKSLAVGLAPHSNHPSCAGAGTPCAGSCDGNGGCSFPGGTCGSGPTCSGTSLVGQSTCSGGSCVPPAPIACAGGLVCSGAACKLSCAADTDCLSSYFCAANSCHRDATQISAGDTHTCALLGDGTVQCWGANGKGQLGNSSTTLSSIPLQVNTTSGAFTGATAIASGGSHTCALLSNGTASCWGSNMNGQLGNSSVAAAGSTAPVPVTDAGGPITGATGLTAGIFHTCALLSDGTVKCWGSNDNGQLGNGAAIGTMSATPVTVTGLSGATRISGAPGGHHTCALISGGAGRCWGNNVSGQLGNGMNANSPVPVIVQSGLSGMTSITAGIDHTCALITGSARCWGANYYGQIGASPTVTPSLLTPVTVPNVTGATQVTSALVHNCALLPAGTVSCWGANFYGMLGDSSVTASNSYVPVAVVGLNGVAAISGGSYHTCALLSNGSGVCWGQNIDGRLGNGMVMNSTMPVPISPW